MSFSWQKLSQAKPIIGLAPMDGMTDFAFRQMHATKGKPDLCFTEFTHVEGMWHGNLELLRNFLYHLTQGPVIAQIYGKKPDYFYKAALMVCAMGFDGIDINMGCPAKTVTHSGGGAALIANPDLAAAIISAVQQATQDWAAGKELSTTGLSNEKINYLQKIYQFSRSATPLVPFSSFVPNNTPPPRHQLPVSIKTRIGIEQPNTVSWITHLLNQKPDNISIHGRTLKQMYTGQANWEELQLATQLIRQTNTTCLLNGDITSLADAYNRISQTKAHGVLLGRAALGNPWIWQNAFTYTPKQKLNDALEHAAMFTLINPDDRQYVQMRKHFNFYIKDFPYANEIKVELVRSSTFKESQTIIQNALSEID